MFLSKEDLKRAMDLKFKATGTLRPLTPFVIIGGCVNHVTGTASRLEIFNNNDSQNDGDQIFEATIAAATANGQYPLFNNSTGYGNQQYTFPIVVLTTDLLKFSADASSTLLLRIITI